MQAMALLLKQFTIAFLFTSARTLQPEEETKPLLLSSYLENGKPEIARNLSFVNLPSFNVESYAGFLTVDAALGNHLFFWFFPSSTDPDAPLVVWLNGGPGVSSMLGVFWENGPLAFEKDMNLVLREVTWVGPFSMLYVDNPVGTGFSYSDSGQDGYRFTQDGYGGDLHNLLEQFIKIFPEQNSRGIYIGGQSFAGKYVTAFSYFIHRERKAGRSELNLKGVYLGGPFFDPETQIVANYDYAYALGLISYATLRIRNLEMNELVQKYKKGELEEKHATKITPLFYNISGLSIVDNYVTGGSAPYYDVQRVVDKVKPYLHVGANNFSITSFYVYDGFGPRFLESTKSKMAVLMNNYKVLVFTGDYDILVSSGSVEAALLSTPWSGQSEYYQTEKSVWTSNGTVKGFFSRTRNFCRVVVRSAGHQTPHDQPETSLEMMKRFVHHGCISAPF